MMQIDASMGEGGGQVLRTALALAACTGTAITLRNVRARRRQPGLRPQHLAAVRAAAAICDARTTGATVASRELVFEPGALHAGRYEIDVGTAGSTLLVLQTVLPALSLCNTPSEILLHGGTHNPLAPTFEFTRDAYVPLLARVGYDVTLSLESHGFFPAGGGTIRASIQPLRRGAAPLELPERGVERARSAEVLLSRLPEHIARREIAVLRARLGLAESACALRQVPAHGPGNVVHVRLDCEHLTTVFAGFGERGLAAEKVADDLADEVQRYLDAPVAVDSHLADQLLLPLALAGGGAFSTLRPSGHTQTNAAVIGMFLPIDYGACPAAACPQAGATASAPSHPAGGAARTGRERDSAAQRWIVTLRPLDGAALESFPSDHSSAPRARSGRP